MNLLMLCEGDAESAVESFSGSSKSMIDHLRLAGDTVVAADCDLYGADRAIAAIPVFSHDRRRWSARYHLLGWPFMLRSRRAAAHFRRLGSNRDGILQVGATFAPPRGLKLPYFVFCDSNIRVAQRGIATGQSWAAVLTPTELDGIAAREKTVYDGAAGIFTMSEYLRQSFIDDFAIPPDRVVTTHPGPNMQPPQIALPRARAADAPPTVLFVGAQFERKGGDLLLAAFQDVRQRIPNARLRIIGPRTVPEAPGVECMGFLRKDVPEEMTRLLDAYETADVFCLPTRYEPFGIVYIEAMYYALPCIGPRAWAIPEMVRDGETGFTVEPENRAELANRLCALLADPALAARMGEAGRRLAERSFTWKAATDRMREHMLKHTGGGTRSRP